MPLPASYDALTSAGDANDALWAALGAFLGDRPGWHFAPFQPTASGGIWWFGAGDPARIEVRPWGGRFELTVNYLAAGDDTQIFVDDFDSLKTWLLKYGEHFNDALRG